MEGTISLIENSKKNESASQYTIEELNKRIDKAEASIAQGHVVSHHDVINQMNDMRRSPENLSNRIS